MCLLIGFSAWAMASPTGGSPDDDYHLASIWCPWPADSSGCDYQVEDGEVVSVVVPETVAAASSCYAFHSDVSAACIEEFSDDVFVDSGRFDDGSYPPGYYRFHRVFVGEDVYRSVVVMRLANVLLGLGSLVTVALLASPRLRASLFIAATAAWTPMGVYFVASNNPSSWAISGILTYGAALLVSLYEPSRHRWALPSVGTLGAVMAATSRADAAFYIFIVSLAAWLLFPLSKRRLAPFIWSVVMAVFGLGMFFSSGHSANLTGDGGWPTRTDVSLLGTLKENLLALPDYLAGFWGVGVPPGWHDTPLPTWATTLMILTAGGVVYMGARQLWARKLLASSVLIAGVLGVPVVAMTLRHVFPVTYYQPRYTLPLLAVFFVTWVLGREGESLFAGRSPVVLLATAAGVANAFALARVVERNSTGLLDEGLAAESVWWPWSTPPEWLICVGSLAMAGGLLLTAFSVSAPGRVAEAAAGRARRET
mgnify:CR=1 FL=1